MGDVLDMMPDRERLKDNFEFIVDCARFAEGIASEADVKKKYRFNDDVWSALGEDDELVRKITDEKVRRIRNGSHKREKAQLLVVKAPDVVAKIMLDESANARHRLDAAAGLDRLAQNPQENSPAAAGFFQITINLGSDLDGNPVVEHYNKPIAIDVNDDGAANNGNTAPQRSLPAIDKRWDDGGSNDVVATPAVKKPAKTATKTPIERETVRAKSPQEIALESMMRY